MKLENHIINILQLYEYAMAIGQSLAYKESCDLFLKLLLKRKNLNAAWILEFREDTFRSTYAIPIGKEIKVKPTEEVLNFLKHIKKSQLVQNSSLISSISPITIQDGSVAVFNLGEQGHLFLFSKKNNITLMDLSQLEPVIDKFSIHLQACKVFKEQQQLLHNLEIQNQELSDYAHMVSHDLKSPLRTVDTLASWLIEDNQDKMDEHCTTQLNLIRSNVDKMDALISGILNYSTIDKNQEEAYEVNLNSLVSEVVKMIKVPKHISIEVSELPNLVGDKYRLQQLFQNLIENAVKYNDKEKGVIIITCKEKAEEWKFSIQDNGKGIEEAYHNKIFKMFEKLENTANSTGIGLSVVKKIVNLYGGRIWLDSKPGKGSTFYFTLRKELYGNT